MIRVARQSETSAFWHVKSRG